MLQRFLDRAINWKIVGLTFIAVILIGALGAEYDDDGEVRFGIGDDYSIKFDSVSGDLEIVDAANNILWTLTDDGTTGDVNATGAINAGSAAGSGTGDIGFSGELLGTGTGISYLGSTDGFIVGGTDPDEAFGAIENVITVKAAAQGNQTGFIIHGNATGAASTVGRYIVYNETGTTRLLQLVAAIDADGDDSGLMNVMLADADGALQTVTVFDDDEVRVGGGYGATGVTISDAGVIQANGNITVDGTIGGFRQYIGPFLDDTTLAEATPVYVKVGSGVAGAAANGIALPRAGDITGISVKLDITAAGNSDGNISFEVYKNGGATGLICTEPTSGGVATGLTATATQAKGTDTFAAGDKLQVVAYEDDSGTATIDDVIAMIEIHTD